MMSARFTKYLLPLCMFVLSTSSQCADGPDGNEVKVNAWSINIPSDGGEFIFKCENYPLWTIEKIMIIDGDTEKLVYCTDGLTYTNEWLTVRIPDEDKNNLIVTMQAYTKETSRSRGAMVEMKCDNASATISATQYPYAPID